MQKVNKYTILEKLGSQRKRKFGTTYLVEHQDSKKKAVLKHLKKKNAQPHIYQRLIEESKFSFENTSLPQVLNIEEHASEIFLLLEYKPGITIDVYWKTLKRRERLPFICSLLEKLHVLFEVMEEQKIVHCDIKPSNILIEKKGDDFNVHLIDFGLSVRENNAKNRKLLFPLGYAAPELLLNYLDIVNQQTDQFSLGILIWRLYVGRLPLTHPNPSIFTNLQLTHPLPEHSLVPKKVFGILQRMSHKHPFKLPPNKMEKSVIQEKLIDAMNLRYDSFEEITEAFKSIKPPFYQIRSRR